MAYSQVSDPLDNGVAGADCVTESNETEAEKKYYILTIKAETHLENGFRYIKELLLQIHNFKMYEAYAKLTQAGITVYSVKTDAFIIDARNVSRVQELLDFNTNVGGWRVSKEECPPQGNPTTL